MNKNLSKLLFIFSAVIVFGFMFNMFGDGDVVPMPMNERVQVLDGNYTVVGDVNGQLLIGYKEPYQGDTEDAAAYNTYINTSSFADVSILDVQGSAMFASQSLFHSRVVCRPLTVSRRTKQ